MDGSLFEGVTVSDRRRVLKVLAGCATAAAASASVGPALAFLTEAGDSGGGMDVPWIRLMRLEAIPLSRPTKVSVVGSQVDAWTRWPQRRLGAVWLIRDSDTRVRAFSAICPHLGCAIEFARGGFYCPCHDSAFDLQGQRRSGPSPRGLDPLEVRVMDGWVSVRYRRFRLGVPQRVEI